ncbi:class I ribonucleotide reductase maintenance protein YfaE [Thorsellia anophelis]|uniref:Ferredoxin n=1 Tax=Thorsellia anophelis DSM 18579 TaxID=1123402 RepID=A0A1I0CI65_9GAMM|nr:class I ribonucleotide reductase maintenance protein YfaE [Thorsellia anophelis]SET19105.1 ferredoxin [Thorsellia anophelis DSM 18579]
MTSVTLNSKQHFSNVTLQCKIKLVHQNKLIYRSKGEVTLLETLKKNNVRIDFQCKEGYCGACRTKIKKGSVQYITDPLAYLEPNDILPCCCFPLTDLELEL